MIVEVEVEVSFAEQRKLLLLTASFEAFAVDVTSALAVVPGDQVKGC